jgi:hypothetical protein
MVRILYLWRTKSNKLALSMPIAKEDSLKVLCADNNNKLLPYKA